MRVLARYANMAPMVDRVVPVRKEVQMATVSKGQKKRDAAIAAAVESKPAMAHVQDLMGVLQVAGDATLVGALKAGLSLQALVAMSIANRGLHLDTGAWVGFAEAEALAVARFPELDGVNL